MLNIDFEPKNDRNQFYEDSRVKTIIELLMGDGKSFCNSISYLLFNCSSSDDFGEYCPIIYSLEQNKLESCDPKLKETYRKIIGLLSALFDDKTLSGNLKGAILELWVYSLMLKKYEANAHINGHILIEDWRSPRSVDVMGIASEKNMGECYECKSVHEFLDDDDIDNLKEIHEKSNFIIDPKVASFAKKKAIEFYINNNLNPSCTPIECIGRDELNRLVLETNFR